VNLDELQEWEKQGRLTTSAFRLECLDQYLVDSDQDNVTRYLNGGDKPSWADGDDWMQYLVEEKGSGIRRFRVHVLSTPLHPYLRYECEWGYVYTSQAGEEIYILDTTETPRPEGLTEEEFWLFDDKYVVIMHYDDEGHFLDAEALPESETPRYREHRDHAMQAAVPFHEWWARHPEEHRENWSGG
jgi:hypothetical protein